MFRRIVVVDHLSVVHHSCLAAMPCDLPLTTSFQGHNRLANLRTIWILGSTKFAKKPFRGVQTALSKLLRSK